MLNNNFIERFRKFILLPEVNDVTLSIVGFSEILKNANDPLHDPVTDRVILKSGIYAHYAGKIVRVSKYIKNYHIAIVKFQNDTQPHSLEGPAIVYDDGHKEYYIDGVRFDFEEWSRRKDLQVFK